MAWYDLEKGAKVPQPQGQEVADWYRGTDADLSMSETLHVMANIKAQRDSLLAALEELLDSIQAVNNSMEDFHIWGPRLKNACLDAGKAIAAVKQEGAND